MTKPTPTPTHPILILSPNFHGRLEDLLRLVRARELDAGALMLAEIASQVLAAGEEAGIDELSDAVVILAQLVLEKTRAVLGMTDPEPLADELEQEDLDRAAAIEVERRILGRIAEEAAEVEVAERRTASVGPGREGEGIAVGAAPPPHNAGVSRDEAEAELDAAAHTLRTVDLYPQAQIAAEILHLVEGDAEVTLEHFRNEDPARIVAAFLALLELVRSRRVRARQARPFHELVVTRGAA